MTMMHNIPKLGLVSIFSRDRFLISNAIRQAFSSLLTCGFPDVVEELEDLNLAGCIVKDWLGDGTTVSISLADAGKYA